MSYPNITPEDLDNWFTHHPPKEDQIERYQEIRAAGKAFAEVLVKHCPHSADRTAAIRHIRDAVATANMSIACNE